MDLEETSKPLPQPSRSVPRRSRTIASAVAVLLAVGTLAGCQPKRRSNPYGVGQFGQPGQQQPGGWGQQPPPQPGGWGQQPPPQPGGWGQQPPPQPTQQAPGPQPNLGPVANDPINNTDIAFLRQRAGVVLKELVAALPDAKRGKVQGIPLFSDPTVGEVNAFAACDDQGQPLMAVSDALLEVMAHSARFRAYDELFGGGKLDSYTTLVAKNYRPKKPLPRPGPGFVDPAQDADGRKVARQAVLLDAQLAFVLGHELAHHHLDHTGCANGGGSRGVSVGDFGRMVSRAAPFLNQPNEIAADVAGTQNLLSAGKRRTTSQFQEDGALLSLNFFGALDRLTPEAILFGFESTHPHPSIRIPIVQQTASSWRMTGGNVLPFPF